MGGIHGKIVSIDGNEVTLDVDRGTKIKFDKNNVYNQFENYLPITIVKTRARDIDTYEDYLRAIEFVNSWVSDDF